VASGLFHAAWNAQSSGPGSLRLLAALQDDAARVVDEFPLILFGGFEPLLQALNVHILR
jgi:hypothetical protein